MYMYMEYFIFYNAMTTPPWKALFLSEGEMILSDLPKLLLSNSLMNYLSKKVSVHIQGLEASVQRTWCREHLKDFGY